MFGSTTLDVAIGIFFLYFVLSIVSSAVMETIALTLALRAQTMYKAIDGLLDGLDVTTTDFFRSPHIAPLALDDYPTGEKRRRIWVWLSKLGACPAFGKGIPTYIPAERFTTALMALMQARKNEAPSPPQFQKLASAVQNNVSAAVPKVAGVVAGPGSSQEAAAATTNNPPPALHAAHLFIANTQEALGADASDGEQLQHLRAQFDKWYSETMDRASGWYKRTTQKWIFALGCVIVLTLNIDSIALIQRLSHDTGTRTMLAHSAVAATQTGQGINTTAPTDMKSQEAMHTMLADVDNLALPLGWQKGDVVYSPRKVGGLLITIFAISLGAPFWFEILSMLVNLRSAGPVPKDPTKTAGGVSPTFTLPAAPGTEAGSGAGLAKVDGAAPASPLVDDYWSAAKRKDDWSGFKNASGIFERGAAMARCAVLAYENEFFVRSVLMGSWNLSAGAFCTFLNPGGTQAFVVVIEDAIIVAFRGTEASEFADIIDDACCSAIKREDLGSGVVSVGFAASLDERLAGIDGCVANFMKGGGAGGTVPTKLFVTGHSLGGALATLYASHAAVAHFGAAEGQGVGALEVHLFTYGSPRVGDRVFAKDLETALGYDGGKWQEEIDQGAATPEALANASRVLRYVDHNDIVTRVPPDDVFTHAGPSVYLTAGGNSDLTMTQSKRFEESLMDVVANFKALASSSLADHASGKYLSILEGLARRG